MQMPNKYKYKYTCNNKYKYKYKFKYQYKYKKIATCPSQDEPAAAEASFGKPSKFFYSFNYFHFY